MIKTIDQSIIHSLKTGKPLKININEKSKLKIERKLPFLLIFREVNPVDQQVMKLVLGESSYLIIDEKNGHDPEYTEIIRKITRSLSEEFGAVMILELWVGDHQSQDFVIKATQTKAPATIQTLVEGLESFCLHYRPVKVKVEHTSERHPPHLLPLLTLPQCHEIGAYLVGLEIPPFFLDLDKGEFYHLVFREFKLCFSQILRKTIFEFIRVQTSFNLRHHHMLGSTQIQDLVWKIDQALFKIQSNYQFLILVSPVNGAEAKREFIENKYKGKPKFLYRLLPVDPDQLKEDLFRINIRQLEDPAFSSLFMEKREELEKQLTMLKERGTSNFLMSSIRLYSSVDKDLYEIAKSMLLEIPPPKALEDEWMSSSEMAEKCREEVAYYREFFPELDAKVEIKPDLVGMLVSKGQLYIGESYQVKKSRAEALVHHEIGTHVLTFYNGKIQPLSQLSIGLAGYEELQEGIAVLSEYLSGGLDSERMRVLAARVVAAHSLTEGSNFEETFRKLVSFYRIEKDTAFQITARIHQSGGFTKDLIYLRGLIQLLNYLKEGGDFELLFYGKIALKHVPLIQELRTRGVLKPMPMYPRFLKGEIAQKRLQKLRDGITIFEMLQ
jgi:uncharacterized protein (TIGR02421 family)